MRKIAVVGGGIFGCCAALKLSEDSNNRITLYESGVELLSGASRYNQCRVHAGYHYPRSKETAIQSLYSRKEFLDEFSDSILSKSISHYYCIADSNSMISRNEYIQFLLDSKLRFDIQSKLEWIDNSRINLIIRADENLYDPEKLAGILMKKLELSGVEILFNRTFLSEMIDDYDIVINATYANINRIVSENDRINYQFEICQKPIVKLDPSWKDRSVVILDGPFLCIDPMNLEQQHHAIGHVKNAIIHSNIGHFPEIPIDLHDVMYGRMKMNIDLFLPDMNYFFPGIQVENISSMITIRTVLPNREYDDARPSYITKHSDKLYSIFSGKVGTSIQIAKDLCKMI